MNIPPLCIIQARYGSTRLPGKMLLTLGDETLIARAWRIACEAFGAENCVVAIPAFDALGPLGEELASIGGATVSAESVEESDVLGRFWLVAHAKRWHPDSVIVRYTPDDPFKTVEGLQRVAAGERLPVEIGGEAFTLAMLDAAHAKEPSTVPGVYLGDCVVARPGPNPNREHLTHALFDTLPPTAPEGQVWTIDTQDDLDAARAIVDEQTATGSQRNGWGYATSEWFIPTEAELSYKSPFDGGPWGPC